MIFLNIAKALNMIKSVTAGLVIALGVAGICAIIFFSIFKVKKINSKLAIITSTILSCFLMVPVISAFNNYVEIKIDGIVIDELEMELKEARAELITQVSELVQLQAKTRAKSLEQEILRNQETIARQTIEIETLNDNVNLLKNTRLSIQSFQKILELALLEVNLDQALVRKERLGTVRASWIPPFRPIYEEILVVLDHDIIAKFGVDLNEVKIATMYGNTALISGIRPKFIGTSRNITNYLVEEIRRIEFNGDGTEYRVDMQNNRKQEAANRARTYERNFQMRLSEEFNFMDSAVIQLAQDFISVMLAPLFTNIVFDNANRPNALPLIEYLERELKEYDGRIANLHNSNESLALENVRLESEIQKIETEHN